MALFNEFSRDSTNCQLFKKIFQKLGSEFISESMRNEAAESHCRLEESIKKYFKYQIIMDATVKAVESQMMFSDTNSSFSQECDSMIHPIYLSVIKKYVPQDESSGSLKLFGLHQEYLSKILEMSRKSQSDNTKKELTKQVENNIVDFFKKITEYSGHVILHGTNWKKSFSEALKNLSSKAVLLDVKDTTVSSKRQALQEMYVTYHKELAEGLIVMNKILQYLEEQFKYNFDLAEYYSLKCSTLQQKMKFFELEILKATYTEDSIPALKIISEQLDEKEYNLSNELVERTASVDAYQILGPKYEELVQEYTQLLEDIKKQKMAVEILTRKEAEEKEDEEQAP